MNKVKMFFIAAALVLTTAGVFAGKAKFQTQSGLFYYSGTAYVNLAPGTLPSGRFNTTGTTPAQLQSSASTSYILYTNTGGSNYSQVYTNGF